MRIRQGWRLVAAMIVIGVVLRAAIVAHCITHAGMLDVTPMFGIVVCWNEKE